VIDEETSSADQVGSANNTVHSMIVIQPEAFAEFALEKISNFPHWSNYCDV